MNIEIGRVLDQFKAMDALDNTVYFFYQTSLTTRKTGRMPVCSAAPVKRAHVNTEGTLRLAWWEGNQALKGVQKDVQLNRQNMRNKNRPVFPVVTFDMRRGTILEGDVKFSGNAADEIPGIYFETPEGEYYAIRLISASATAAGKIKADGTGDIA